MDWIVGLPIDSVDFFDAFDNDDKAIGRFQRKAILNHYAHHLISLRRAEHVSARTIRWVMDLPREPGGFLDPTERAVGGIRSVRLKTEPISETRMTTQRSRLYGKRRKRRENSKNGSLCRRSTIYTRSKSAKAIADDYGIRKHS